MAGGVEAVKVTKYDTLYFRWDEKSQSIADNTTTVSWVMELTATGSGRINSTAKKNWKVTVNGTAYSGTNTIGISANSTKTLASGTTKIAHNADGTKTFSYSFYQEIEVTFSGTFIKEKSGSGSGTLTTIPRNATITAAPDFNDEANPTITYSNLAGNAATLLQACISLDGSNDDIAYRDISKTGTKYTFNLTEAERNVLRSATKTITRTVRFYVKSTVGGVTSLKYLTKTLTITNALPTMNPTIVDTDSATLALTNDENVFIKGYSNAAFAFNASGKKYATIMKYKITCGDGKSSTASSGTLNNVSSGTFKLNVVDTRGYSTTKTITKTLVDYIKPTSNLKGNLTTDGVLTFTASGNYFNGSFAENPNALTLQYRYKESGGTYSEWADITPTITNNTYKKTHTISGLDYRVTYVIQTRAKDKLVTANSAEVSISAYPIFDWSEKDFNFNVDVKLQENAIFKNGGVGIRGTTTDGVELQALQPCNSNNNLVIGYGGYTESVGATNIYGNELKLITNGSVYVNGSPIGENKVLWSGSYYMTEGQTATLSEGVNEQITGIILVFSRYDIANSEELNEHFNYHFVPKQLVALQSGKGSIFNMSTSNETFAASKYLYIANKEIKGHANNDATGTGNTGVTYNNNRFVLRYVIGV